MLDDILEMLADLAKAIFMVVGSVFSIVVVFALCALIIGHAIKVAA